MSADSLLPRWRASQSAKSFTPAEAGAIADLLVERGWLVYSDRKHPDHAALSAEVAELRAVAAPGFIGPGGEVVESSTASERLFR